MADRVTQFDWVEYLVFGLMLSMSALIGVYYGFIKGGQDTADGYLLGGKKMQVLPIALSMMCTHISGVTMLGIPTEIYTFGTQYMASALGIGLLGLALAYVMVPVFYTLQEFSLFKYLEMRFNRCVSKTVSFIYALSLLLHLPIVMYGPGLVLNQGWSIFLMTSLLSLICIFYTTVGGLKAVVWTDTIQGGVMILSSIVVAAIGTVHVGGWSAVISAAREGDRLEMFNFDPDPRRRTTFWTAGIGASAVITCSALINPANHQRFLALPTMKKAQWSAFYYSIGCFFFNVISAYMGLILYAKYRGCDPLHSGLISKPDQILPLFVTDSTLPIRGLPGLFVAGIVSAALSSMSGGLNTVAGTLYYDFLEGWFGKTTERKTSLILKGLAGTFGAVCLLLVLIVEKLETILELSISLLGLSVGIVTGIIFLGMFVPQVNSKGASVGAVTALVVVGWMLLGSKAAQQSGEIVYLTKPISVEACAFNVTTVKSVLEPSFGKAFPLFEISVYYFCIIGCIISMTVGIAVSFITGANRVGEVKRELLSPLIYRYLPAYSAVSTREVELSKIPEVEGLCQ